MVQWSNGIMSMDTSTTDIPLDHWSTRPPQDLNWDDAQAAMAQLDMILRLAPMAKAQALGPMDHHRLVGTRAASMVTME